MEYDEIRRGMEKRDQSFAKVVPNPRYTTLVSSNSPDDARLTGTEGESALPICTVV
jgi:hypothetical protein